MDKFTITSDRQIEPLNVPHNWEEINTSSINKYASSDIEKKVKGMDLGGYDILKGIKDNPEHLFVKVFAIKKDEVNDNGDYFGEVELKKAAKTFIGVPVFVNHQNDDIEKARGKVVHAWWDDNKGGIYTINMVDKAAYPRLARGIEAGYITGSSMGASVKFSCCSICHKRAANAKEYCSHIRERKKKNFNGDHECEYHKSANAGNESCPVCECKQGTKQSNKYANQQIFEHNYGVKFIEDSFVVNPACHDCLVSDVINPGAFLKKVASIREVIAKLSVSAESDLSFGNECASGQCGLHKAAGKQEISELNDAMNQLERVARSMMAQKNKVSLEYVSNIIKVTADIQKVSDELVEMGYATLPSPTENEIAYGTNTPASPTVQTPSAVQAPIGNMPQPSMVSQPSMQPSLGSQIPQQQPMIKSLPGASSPQIQELGDEVGRVTRPNYIPVRADSAKDFLKLSNSIMNRLSEIMGVVIFNGDSMSENSGYKYTQGNDTVVISSDSDGETHVSHLNGDRLIKWSSIDSFDEETQNLISNNPKQAARKILDSYMNINTSEELNKSMDIKNNNKVAQAQDSDLSSTTESQLNSFKGLHSRTGEAASSTTDSQLDSASSAAPRRGSYDSIVESTLNSKSGGFMARWGYFPEVITEAQWTDISREVLANIPADWTSVPQGAQLDMLRSTFSWSEPNSTTEGQLSGKSTKRASAQDLIKQAQSAVADAMAFYGIGSSDISKSVSFFNSDSARRNKAKVIIAVNGAPWAVSARKANNGRLASFSKVASEVYGVEPIDAVLAAIGDNVGSVSAEEILSAVSFVAGNKLAMQQAEALSVEKFEAISSGADTGEDMFRKAFSEMSLPEDGLIKVCMSAEDDLGMEVSGDKIFINAVHKYAQNMVNENLGRKIEVVPVTIDVDEENGLVEATCKIASKLTDQEKQAFNKWSSSSDSVTKVSNSEYNTKPTEQAQNKRASLMNELNQLEKSAQLAGGQMPASLNPAGMGMGVQLPGGALPPGAPGVEALTTGAPMSPEDGGMDPLAGGDMMGEETESKPKPPGAVCIVCGNNDVDVQGGKSKCNGPGCGLNYTIKIIPDASLLDKISDGDVDEEDISGDPESPEKGLGGEGPVSDAMPGMPGSTAPGGMPGGMAVAASTKISSDVMKKIASKGEFGSISPISGERNTIRLDKEHWQCLDSGQIYRVRLAAKAGDEKNIYAQWEWSPTAKKASCSSCHRRKSAIVKALASVGISEGKFDKMSMSNKASILNTINDKGLLGSIKEASSNNTRGFFKKAFTVQGKFPMEMCIHKLANRYGDNALALSGPCEGKNLAECVCGSLSDENVYTTGLANKVASTWAERDGMHECVEDFVRNGLPLEKSAQACEDIKSKYITEEEMFAETISDIVSIKSAQNENAIEDEDPFDSEEMSEDSEEVSEDMSENPEDMDDSEFEDNDDDFDEVAGGYHDDEDEDEVLEDADADAGLSIHLDSGLAGKIEERLSEVPDDLDMEIDMSEDEMSEDDMDEMSEDEMSEDEMSEDEMSEDDMDGMSEDEMSEDTGEEVMDSEEDMNNQEEGMMEEASYMESPKQASESDVIARLEKEANSLRHGRIVGVNKLNIDVDSIRAALNKSAGKVTPTSAQDTVKGIANGKPHPDSTQEGFKAPNPKVPSNSGKPLSGSKGEKLSLDMPEIPSGKGKFPNETNEAEIQDTVTGGQGGQGANHTGKYRKASNMFDQALAKLAKDMGLEVSTVQDDADIAPISNGKPHADSTQEGFSAEDVDVPCNNGDPLSSEEGEGFNLDVPSIPAGDGQMGNEAKLGLSGEKQNNITGGQDGQGGSSNMRSKKANSANKEVAIKLAAKMVESGLIKAEQLSSKLVELQRYEVSQLRDLERAMFNRNSVTKGLKIASSGVEHPLVISEASSQKNASVDLKSKIASLFRLQQQVEMANDSEAAKLRNAFK